MALKLYESLDALSTAIHIATWQHQTAGNASAGYPVHQVNDLEFYATGILLHLWVIVI